MNPRASQVPLGVLAALLLLASACQTSVEPILPSPGDRVLVAFGQDLDPWPRDGWSLLEASVEDESLSLTFQHPGGCEEHRYWLLATSGFTELPSAGPVPMVSVPLLLAHDDGGDTCEAILTRTVAWSLLPLREEYARRFGPGPVILVLRVPAGQGTLGEVTVSWGP